MMNKLKISTRLFLLTGLLSSLLVVTGAIGLYGISRSNAALQTVYDDRTVCMGQLDIVARRLLANRIAINRSLLTPTPERIAADTAEIEANLKVIRKTWDEYAATYAIPEEKKLSDTFAADEARLSREVFFPVMEALRTNDLKVAHDIAIEKMRPLFAPVEAGLDALIKIQLDEAHHEYTAAVQRYETIRAVALVSIFAGLAAAMALGLTMVRGISRSLAHAMDSAHAVAKGDLTHDISVEGRDEIAQLLLAMQVMKQSLVRVVSEVRQGVDSVGTASAQIAAGNQDLSSRTEQQASNLQETAASMEELTSTVRQNADNARQADRKSVV